MGNRGEQRDVKEAARWEGYSANEQWEGGVQENALGSAQMDGFLPHSRPHCGSSHIPGRAHRLFHCTGSRSHIHSPQHTLLGTWAGH